MAIYTENDVEYTKDESDDPESCSQDDLAVVFVAIGAVFMTMNIQISA